MRWCHSLMMAPFGYTSSQLRYTAKFKSMDHSLLQILPFEICPFNTLSRDTWWRHKKSCIKYRRYHKFGYNPLHDRWCQTFGTVKRCHVIMIYFVLWTHPLEKPFDEGKNNSSAGQQTVLFPHFSVDKSSPEHFPTNHEKDKERNLTDFRPDKLCPKNCFNK